MTLEEFLRLYMIQHCPPSATSPDSVVRKGREAWKATRRENWDQTVLPSYDFYRKLVRGKGGGGGIWVEDQELNHTTTHWVHYEWSTQARAWVSKDGVRYPGVVAKWRLTAAKDHREKKDVFDLLTMETPEKAGWVKYSEGVWFARGPRGSAVYVTSKFAFNQVMDNPPSDLKILWVGYCVADANDAALRAGEVGALLCETDRFMDHRTWTGWEG